MPKSRLTRSVLLSFVVLTTVIFSSTPSIAAESIYWCPGGLGRERLLFGPEPECVPLVEEREGAASIDVRIPPTLKANATLVATLMQQYRHFLVCCATDPALLDVLIDLERRASDILKQQLSLLPVISLRTGQGAGWILPVAQVRHQLVELRMRLKQIAEIQEKLDTLDFESAGRERRRREELIESIERDFPHPREIRRAPTGPEIGTLGPGGRVGSGIGLQPPAGHAIGVTPPTGKVIGTTSPTGPEIGITPPTGPAIGETPPTGPEIGNSQPRPRR